MLRHLGLAARFVSGYLIQLKPDVKSLDGPAGTDRRFHRSARLDRGLSAGRRLDRPRPDVRACWPAKGTFRSPARPIRISAAPITGAVDAVRSRRSSHEMTVTRIHETPRVTKPYTRRAVGDDRGARRTRSTRDLTAGDVRLTMGGEPTFVSIDDMDGAEWNTAAWGPTKRRLAGELIRRLARALRAGRAAALRPGQMVSRRAAAALGARLLTGARTASRSGTTRALIADESKRLRRHGRADARRVLRSALAERLRRRSESIVPGLRGCLLLPLAGTAPAGQRRSARQPSSTNRWSASAWRKVFEQASTTSSATSLPLRARLAGRNGRAGAAGRGSCAPRNVI